MNIGSVMRCWRGADSAHLLLIQPTGDIEMVPVAVWNKLHREPMAGGCTAGRV
ncbi:capsule biosynthesis GfcC family protein [Aeromonas veronii]|uniref:capsule biosynthesis GfcC family protein n=1 Tax=Aeromonas veronii TaxID=654 RepID=UPI003C6F97F9